MALASIGGVPHLSSKISLVFASSEIRYEGILYSIDTKNSTITLAKVKSFGTEDRPTDCPAAPRDEVHEYTIFRGTDIKDIRICQPAMAPTGDKKETLKFGGEYDFDKANEEFKEVLEKLQVSGDLIPNVDFWFWRKDLFKNAACMPSNEIQNETL